MPLISAFSFGFTTPNAAEDSYPMHPLQHTLADCMSPDWTDEDVPMPKSSDLTAKDNTLQPYNMDTTANVLSNSIDNSPVDNIAMPGVISASAMLPSSLNEVSYNPWSTTRPLEEEAAPSSTQSPSKVVLIKEVDCSIDLWHKLYTLSSSYNHLLAVQHKKKLDTQNILQATNQQWEALRSQQVEMLNHLQSKLAIKEKKLSTQTENMERGLAERDIVISQQAELLNKLQEDLVEVGPRTMTAARAEIETHFQRHMADRESEFTTLVQNHETLQKNFEAMERLVQSSPTRLSSDQGPSSPRRHQSSSARVTLVGKYMDNNMTPQTAQTPQTPLPSGVPAFSPSAASSPIEVNAGMIAQQVYNLINQNHFSEPPPSPTPRSLPKKRSSSVQQTKLEISNDKECSENLAHVRDLFDNIFSISKDEEVYFVEGASREEVKA
ncbi:hypothetical protein PAXINDRAFT_18203 [Paxillus involutus ATCC 200175]|uniref:Uncharacterized protein n=1 Tax=Paxillus involutus ATCC 200175 TaxID=664439 RepID=A0A0C9SZI4_PAXIN|nr:hypothetical protein PAXINDRAFT_18203 [Paxillus involutus ATCC 200175]